jgi:peroxiredoxin
MASVDDPDTNKKFAESTEADFVILSDPGKAIASNYGVLASGRPYASRWTFYIGPDGKILDVDREVKPGTAGEDMVSHLEKLGVQKK